MHPTAKIQTRGRLTLPAEVRRALGAEQGDDIYFVETSPGRFEVRMQAPRAALLGAPREARMTTVVPRRTGQLELGF